MAVDGIGLGAIGIGALLAYAGVKGVSVPSEVQKLIQGSSPATAAKADQIAGTSPATAGAGSAAQQAAAAAGTGSGGSPSANKAIGAILATAYGWGPGTKNWSYLESGWQEESGWSTTAANDPSDPYNHAYGIPQANPGTKMATVGADWKSSATTQIRWGLQYIQRTYGSPVGVPLWSANGPLPGYVGY